jgi:hypothetical protein
VEETAFRTVRSQSQKTKTMIAVGLSVPLLIYLSLKLVVLLTSKVYIGSCVVEFGPSFLIFHGVFHSLLLPLTSDSMDASSSLIEYYSIT